jgi:outer membrane lipoprotein-sorting protein
MKKFIHFLFFLALIYILPSNSGIGQDATQLVKQVKAKLDKVKDYSANATLRTDVPFLKVPVAEVQIYFRLPDKFKITKEKGVSILPRGGVSVSMQNILNDPSFVAIDAGKETINGQPVRVVRVLPGNTNADVVVAVLYIDEKNLLVKKAITTTKDSGTYTVEMSYGKWVAYALPDKTLFTFNTKDYKLPKGVTMEFDDGERPDANRLSDKKGYVEITYLDYKINKGVSDAYFSK